MRIFLIGGNIAYQRMFNDLGFIIEDDIYSADVLCFTGGADVNPELYGEEQHPLTFIHPERDVEEIALFKFALNRRIPMVGICRGAQFLHVMNGGRLWQDVDNHAINGTHKATDVLTGETVMVTSTHHQMMEYKHGEGELVCKADVSFSKTSVVNGKPHTTIATRNIDVEVMYHKQTRCLCFQPHPELEGAESTYLYFKNLLERYNYVF